MFNLEFPWTKRRKARLAAEQKARRVGLGSLPFDGYTAQGGLLTGAPESVSPPAGTSPAWQDRNLVAGGGTFDGGGASGDWSSPSCSSSSDSSSSGSSDSGSSCSSD